MALQEVSMSKTEWPGFSRHCLAKGYKSCYVPGPVSTRATGGVAWLVHKSVRRCFAESFTHQGVQICAVWTQGVRCINVYCPPGHEQVCSEAIAMFWASFKIDSHDWAILGDFNCPPDEKHVVPALLFSFGATLISLPTEPTRWQGRTCIDWAMGRVSQKSDVKFDRVENNVVLSDHKGFWINLLQLRLSPWKGRLPPSPGWYKPPSVSSEKWNSVLERAWSEITNGSCFGLRLDLAQHPRPDQGKIQEEWDLFMVCLQECFISAIEILRLETSCEDLLHELQGLKEQPGLNAKGAVAYHQWCLESTRAAGNPAPGEGLRKLRRKLARLFEVRRCCKLSIRPPSSLLNKVCPQICNQNVKDILVHVEKLIHDIHTEQRKLESAQSSDRLRKWKDDMNQGTFKKLGKWIRCKESYTEKFSVYNENKTAENRQQGAQMIFDHWK